MIVLDTNVVSELMRARPSDAVLAWLGTVRAREQFTTAITLAEIRFGLARLPSGRRRTSLEAAAEAVFTAFHEQVLSFDQDAAWVYGALMARAERSGRRTHVADGQIAAICSAHGATLATRNLSDFAHTGVDLVDPWQVALGGGA